MVDRLQKWKDWLVGVEVNVYPDDQGLQYFNTNQKPNSTESSWYLHMSDFRYDIHYRAATKMREPDGLSRRSVEEQSGMHGKLFQEGQLLDLEVDENVKDSNADDIELARIDISKSHTRDRLLLFPEEHRLEVLRQRHDSPMAGHSGRHRPPKLISRTSHCTDGQKMWQTTFQDAYSVKIARQIDTAGRQSWYQG